MCASSASLLIRTLLGLPCLGAFVRPRCSKNPLVLTPNSSHISVIGQTAVFLAIQAYFTAIPLQSTPPLFFRCRAPSSPAPALRAAVPTPSARNSQGAHPRRLMAAPPPPAGPSRSGSVWARPEHVPSPTASCPPLTSLTASSLISTVYRARCFDPPFLLTSYPP